MPEPQRRVTLVPQGDQLERLLAERGAHLLRAAVLLTGNQQDGEDLLQAALERLLRQRRRIDGSLEAYLRRTLYHLTADGWRRNGTWRKKLALIRASEPSAAPQQRAVIVLRYWEQLTEAETAAMLGCSDGTVKSAASRGLKRIRELSGPWLISDGELVEKENGS